MRLVLIILFVGGGCVCVGWDVCVWGGGDVCVGKGGGGCVCGEGGGACLLFLQTTVKYHVLFFGSRGRCMCCYCVLSCIVCRPVLCVQSKLLTRKTDAGSTVFMPEVDQCLAQLAVSSYMCVCVCAVAAVCLG